MVPLLIFAIPLCTYVATHEKVDDKTKVITFVGTAILGILAILFTI
jgi:hypothetical protein